MRIKRRPFFSWTLLPVILSLAWPTMLEQLMQTAVQYIDTAMVGSLGTQATAAVGSTTTINWLITSSISALGVGFLAYIAQACGANEKERALRAVSQTVLATAVCGIFFTVITLSLSAQIPVWMQVDGSIQALAAQYFFILYVPMLPRTALILFGTVFRAVGDSKTPMRIGFLVNLINIIGNFLLIYPSRELLPGFLIPGAGLGVIGAAIASAIAYTRGGIIITIALWKHPDISPKSQRFHPDWQVLNPCLRVALPNMLQRFGTSLGYVAFASMINALGETATAAHTIANTVESAFYIPGYGMQAAAATLAGNTLGACDKNRMRDLSRMLILIEIILMVISGGLLFIFAEQMMGLFSKEATVIMLGTVVLKMVALSEPIYGVSIILEGMMQGVGNTFTPFICNIAGMWGIRIIGTFFCTRFLGLGLVSAWGCMILHNVLLFVLFTIIFLRNRWNPLYKQ